jgi:hypothetical protein
MKDLPRLEKVGGLIDRLYRRRWQGICNPNSNKSQRKQIEINGRANGSYSGIIVS